MKFTTIIENEYKDVSETAVGKVVSLKKEGKLKYEFMSRADTYAEGVHALRESYVEKEAEVPSQLLFGTDGQKIIRPLTFRENILARVEDFETLKNNDGRMRTIEDRLRLFDTWLDSCSGVVYSSQNEDDFMIIPECKELITIPRDFNDEYIQVDYASLQGKGFSLKRSQAKYNQHLTESEVISHPAWIASVGEDMSLLSMYTSIVFNNLKDREGKAMGFYLRARMREDLLKNIFMYGISYNFNTFGLNGFNYGNSSFLRATPPA